MVMNLKTETQTLIVEILGIYAIISLIGIILLVMYTTYDTNLILALVPVTTSPISILGGFIAGKTMTEKQNEEYLTQNENQTEEENECGEL